MKRTLLAVLVPVATASLSVALEIGYIQPGQKGIAVYKERSFYSDALAKCIRFYSVDDRRPHHDGARGHFIFSTDAGKVTLPAASISHILLDNYFNDADGRRILRAKVKSASELNATVSRVLTDYMKQFADRGTRAKLSPAHEVASSPNPDLPQLPSTLSAAGKTYSEVTYSKHDATSVSFLHSTGVAKVPLESLPADVRQGLPKVPLGSLPANMW
jgi:hypothetical protein